MKKLTLGLMILGTQIFAAFPAMASGWNQIDGKWQYQREDQSYIKNQWFQDQDNPGIILMPMVSWKQIP